MTTLAPAESDIPGSVSAGATRLFFAVLFTATLLLRLCHSHLLWPDEDYHLAAAIQLLRGKALYRDFWYDKPPLSALTYALAGAPTGWVLRVFDSVWILAICTVAFRFARELFGGREAMVASGLIAFFLGFDLPGGVIPIAPDFFMILPHLLALWCVWRAKPLVAGGWCGIAFLFNPKGLFVLLACGLLIGAGRVARQDTRDDSEPPAPRALPGVALLLAGFLISNAVAMATLLAQGAATAYIAQVWKWGFVYAKIPPAASSIGDGLRRSLDWLGFHAALVLGSVWCWWHRRTRATRFLAIWAVVSFVAVASGARFSNRYFLQLLPVLAITAARGAMLAYAEFSRRGAVVAIAIVALSVPLVRFGSRYTILARDLTAGRETPWRDAVLDRDSRAVARWLEARKRDGDTLFVWGYRPDVFAYTRMPFASAFWDSQPLTGVPADRHLTESSSLIPEWAAANRRKAVESQPTFIVDGLSRLNPKLAMGGFPEMRDWLLDYRLAGSTDLSLIYERTVILRK